MGKGFCDDGALEETLAFHILHISRSRPGDESKTAGKCIGKYVESANVMARPQLENSARLKHGPFARYVRTG